MAPVLQRYVLAPEAFSVTFPPAQNVVGPDAVAVTVGVGLTVTVTGEEPAVHPNELVAVTEYVPELFTRIDVVVAPVDQRYDVPPDAVRFTLPPEQKVSGPEAVMFGVGSGLTVTVTGDVVAEQPNEFVAVTE